MLTAQTPISEANMQIGCTVQASKEICLARFRHPHGGAGGLSSLVIVGREVHAMHQHHKESFDL